MRLWLFCVFLGDFFYLVLRTPLNSTPSYSAILHISIGLSILMSVLMGRKQSVLWLLIGLLLGAISAAHAWDAREQARIIPMFDLHWRQVRGTVAALPEQSAYGWSWQVSTSQLCDEQGCRTWQHQLRMSDYTKHEPPVIGEEWQWSVRIKPPHGWVDPGLLPREQFDWYSGIDGNATVNRKIMPTRIQPSQGYYLEHIRANIARRLIAIAPDSPSLGLVLGLVLGVRDHITQTQWELVRATGTSHLLAISGLHIALVASMAFIMTSWIWRCSARACCFIPAPRVAWVIAWIFAVIYSALAGFAIPTVRAMIMLTAYIGTQMGYRALPKGYGLLFALALVILWDPLAPLSPSFILSFGAVAVLALGVVPSWMSHSNCLRMLHTQWVATIGLMPVTIWLFQQFSLVGLLANLIAIPYVGWFSVPACFATVICLMIPKVNFYLFTFADYSLQLLFWYLAKLSTLPHAVWHTILPYPGLMWLSSICVVLLITQEKKRWILLASLGLIVSFITIHRHPKPGEMWVTILDVGQGLSVLVQTHQHVLLFDAGPKFPGGVDVGEKIVMPVIAYYGWRQLDAMIISHGDNDHYGGAASVLKQFPQTHLLTSVPEKFSQKKAEYCHFGQHWQWDGVDFMMLHPDADHTVSGNDASCVLKISTTHQQILLPGDVEAEGEYMMIDHLKQTQLKSSVLVAAHHGSKTSSTEEFITRVQPEWVIFSTGFLNRFHFPNQKIVERYASHGIKMLNTADAGAIELRFGEKIQIKKQRDQRCLFNLC